MKCRGKSTRRNIVQDYELEPIAHLQLLAGQTKRSCTGDLLTDGYYCFSYAVRDGSESGSFFCGEHAARHFLGMLGKEALPRFNPLRATGGAHVGSAGGASTQGQRGPWYPVAKQLYDAVNLLVVCWDTPPGPALGDIKQKLV
jgi:hypothetical protein